MKERNNTRYGRMALLVAVLLVSGTPCIALSQDTGGRATMDAAQKSLSNFVENVLTEKNVARFGFQSLAEARSARVGEPLTVMMIGLASIKEYKKGEKVTAQFINPKTFWVPVLVAGDTRAKLEMTEKSGSLVAGEFGGMRTAAKISSARQRLPRLLESGGVSGVKTTALVRVPALAAEFVYVESAQGEFFTPAMLNPERLNLDDDKLYSAEDVLLRLHDIAKEIDPMKVM